MDLTEEPIVVEEVIARVRAKFPEVPDDTVRVEVLRLFQEYHNSRVRTFVPILVEREVVALLLAGRSSHVA